MKREKKFAVLAALLTMLFPLAAAPFSPWDAWREAYNSFERGEQLRGKGDYVQALEAFREARNQYNRVKEARPDWNQRIINTRLADCEKAIAAVQKLLGESEVIHYPSAPAVSPTAAVSTGEVEFLKKELEKYKNKLLESMVELEELRRRLAQSASTAGEVANLLRDQRVMQEKYALLEKRYQNLERQSLQPDTRSAELRNQLIEEKLNSEVIAKRLQLSENRVKKLEEELTAQYHLQRTAEARSAEAVEALQRRERELADLRDLRDAGLRKSAALEQELSSARSAAAEAVRLRTETESSLNALRKQLNEALVSGGNSTSLNTKLNEENQKLRTALAETEKRSAEAREEAAQLQGKQRELQLELVQVRESLQRFDDNRRQLETVNRDLKNSLERERSAAELSGVELKNLRTRNQQLEADMQNWAAKCTKLEKRLESRNQETFQSLAAADNEKRRLTAEINRLRENTATLQVHLEQSNKKKAEVEGRENAMNAELLRLKTAAAALQMKLDGSQAALLQNKNTDAENAKLRQELNDLRKNFQALQKEQSLRQNAAADNKKLQAELESARSRVKEFQALQSDLVRQQRENETLAENSRKQQSVRAKLEESQKELLQQIAALKRALSEKQSAAEPQNISEANRKAEELRAKLEKSQRELLQQVAELKKALAEKQLQNETLAAAGRNAGQEKNEALAEANRKAEELRAKLEKSQQELLREVSGLKNALAEKQRELEQKPKNLPVLTLPEIEPLNPRKAADTGTPAERIAAGRKAESDDKADVAIWNYKTALEADPQNFEAALRLGMLHLRRGDYAFAEEFLQKARTLHPELKAVTIACAEAQIGRGKFGNALALLDPLRKDAPDDYDLLVPCARALAGSGRCAEAAGLLQKAVKLRNSEAAPWLELARVRLYDGKSTEKEAAEAYREARSRGAAPDPELDPKLGKLLDEQRELNSFMTGAAREAEAGRDWDSALWYYRQLAELDPEDQALHSRIALLLLLQEKAAAAEETLTLNLPETPEGFLILALAQLKQQNTEAAGVSLKEAVRRNGGAPLQPSEAWKLLAQEVEKTLNAPKNKELPIFKILKNSVITQ